MGSFDTLKVNCPNCDERVKIQSKAGDCAMAEYTLYDLPNTIAADLEDTSHWCNNCDTLITFTAISRLFLVVHVVPKDE